MLQAVLQVVGSSPVAPVSPTAVIWLVWLLTVVAVVALRNRFFAVFAGVLLGFCATTWSGLFSNASDPISWAAYVLGCTSVAHLLFLTRPRLRPSWFRALVSVPGLTFMAGSILALPWGIAGLLGLDPVGWWVPFVLAAFGLVQSSWNKREELTIVIDDEDAGELARWRSPPTDDSVGLRVVQITDPHLGPFMSPSRLRGICERAANQSPDLIFLTGDFLTMESHHDVQAMIHAFEPLRSSAGRVYACLGNHDHEALPTVQSAFQTLGFELLVDQAAEVMTMYGPLEIVGADFVWRGRKEHLAELFESVGPRSDKPRILLLHDPGAFKHVPDGAADLTLSGHTHGGQVGFVSLGLSWTAARLGGIPDHGLWAQGRNRLYVHRGTGHYGFPIRLGVPGEESVLNLQFSNSTKSV